jgi:hypothetical protein
MMVDGDAADEHRHAARPAGRTGEIQDLALAGDERHGVAERRQRPPGQQVPVAQRQRGAKQADGGQGGAEQEAAPPAEALRPGDERGHGDRADQHEQRQRQPDHQVAAAETAVLGQSLDVDRHERPGHFLGKHEQEGAEPGADERGGCIGLALARGRRMDDRPHTRRHRLQHGLGLAFGPAGPHPLDALHQQVEAGPQAIHQGARPAGQASDFAAARRHGRTDEQTLAGGTQAGCEGLQRAGHARGHRQQQQLEGDQQAGQQDDRDVSDLLADLGAIESLRGADMQRADRPVGVAERNR